MKHINLLALWLALTTVSPWIWAQAEDMPPRGGPEEGLHRGAQASFEDQLTATRAALKITPAQGTVWQAYEDKVRALMADMTRAAPAIPDNQTAPQKIEQSVNTVRDRLTAMEEISAAAKALYAQLDSQQKSIADLRLPVTVPPLYSGLGPPARSPMMGGMRGRPSGPPPQ